jgi:prepilin-type processing-associated H-X9-DG protein
MNSPDPWALAKDPTTGKPDVPYRIAKIRNSSDIILIFDGSQYFNASGTPDGNAHPVGNGLDNWRAQGHYSWGSGLVWPSAVSWDTSLGAQPDWCFNTDCKGYNGKGQQNIRYRHRANTTANTLFVDGHVGSFSFKGTFNQDLKEGKTDMTRKNIWVNPQ